MPSALPADPHPAVGAQVAFLDGLPEDARRYIAANFSPGEWAAKVDAFTRQGFLATTDKDGMPVCAVGDRDAFLADHRRRRQADAELAKRRREADPAREVEHAEHAAAFASHNADAVEQRGGAAAPTLRRRADRLTRRARLQRVRSVLRSAIARRVRPRARGRRAASARRRNGVRSSRAADPSPGEPDPAEGRDARGAA
jgi:hypothetical protein